MGRTVEKGNRSSRSNDAGLWGGPAWTSTVESVIRSCVSPHSKRAYSASLRAYRMWLQQTPQPEFSRLSILRYRDVLLHRKHLAPKSINLQLTALRKLAKEALEDGLIDDVGSGLGCGCRVNRRNAFWLGRTCARSWGNGIISC